jgi:hypothetical protein
MNAPLASIVDTGKSLVGRFIELVSRNSLLNRLRDCDTVHRVSRNGSTFWEGFFSILIRFRASSRDCED